MLSRVIGFGRVTIISSFFLSAFGKAGSGLAESAPKWKHRTLFVIEGSKTNTGQLLLRGGGAIQGCSLPMTNPLFHCVPLFKRDTDAMPQIARVADNGGCL